MAYEYLDKLALSSDDKQKLKRLGAATPAALLSRIRYSAQSRQKFADYLGGDDKVRAVEVVLQSLTGIERERLAPFKPTLGALEAGDAADRPDSKARVDALVHDIQNLRSSGKDAEAEEKAGELRSLLKQA